MDPLRYKIFSLTREKYFSNEGDIFCRSKRKISRSYDFEFNLQSITPCIILLHLTPKCLIESQKNGNSFFCNFVKES